MQGQKVLRDFNIANEANGTGQAIITSFNAEVSNNTLEIHFQWAGKGTSSIPHTSVYGPLISAITVKASKRPVNSYRTCILSFSTWECLIISYFISYFISDFKPDTGESKLSKGAILGIVTSSCMLIILISILAWFFLRKDAENNGEIMMTLLFHLFFL